MVVKNIMLRSGTVGTLILCTAPAYSQEVGGVQTTFGIETGLDYTGNATLEIPDSDDRAGIFTRLSYGLLSETKLQRFSFGASTAFRAEQIDDEIETDIDAPQFDLSYERDGANANFQISADFQRQDVDDVRILSDFITDDGTISVPGDFADLSGTGIRTNYNSQARLELGVNNPLGLEFTIGASGISYEDTTDPALFDTQRAQASGQIRLRPTKTLTNTIRLSVDRFEAEDETDTQRTTGELAFGVAYDVTPRASFNAEIGQTIIDLTEAGVDTTTDAVTGRAGLRYDMPNGDLTTEIIAGVDTDGTERQSLTFGRSLDLPTGTLSGNIGVTRPAGNDAEVIGEINWLRELPTGSINFSANRSVGLDFNDDTRINTTANFNYSYDINSQSAIGFGLGRIMVGETDISPEVDETQISGTYRQSLSRDWDATAGISYRIREEGNAGDAESPSISLSLSREFQAIR